MFALVYLVFIVTVLPWAEALAVQSRFRVPLYMPLLLTAACLLDRFLSIKVESQAAAARWILTAMILIGALTHLGVSACGNLMHTARALATGYINRRFNTAHRDDSETLAYLRANPLEGGTSSHVPSLVCGHGCPRGRMSPCGFAGTS